MSAILGGKFTIFAKAAGGTIKPVTGYKIDVSEQSYKDVIKGIEASPKIKSILFIIFWTIVTILILVLEYKYFYEV